MHAASFSPDGSRVVTPSEGGTARLWDLKAGASLLIITRSANFGSTASFSSGGSLVISAYGVASLQNRHNFAALQNPTQPRGLIHPSALYPAAARIPIAARDCAID